MTHGGERVFRRKRRRTQRGASMWLWLGFVLLFGGCCLALFLGSFSWDDSQHSESSGVKGTDTLPVANAFNGPAYKGSANPRPASKIDPADEKALKRLEWENGSENAPAPPEDFPPLVPTQSQKPDR